MRNKFLYFSLCPLAAATGKEKIFPPHKKRVFPGFSGVDSWINRGIFFECRVEQEVNEKIGK
jgi:hypothetical protein